jgi:dephospho-CoA kinase
MYIIGMTGGIGSGKTEATKLFTELGVPIVDADIISHELTARGQVTLKEIAQAFGQDILNDDGDLNRTALRKKVFANSEARKSLEDILHPAIFNKALEALKKNASAPYQILAIPLLFESDRYLEIISRSLVIDSPIEMQITRASKRDGLLEADIQKIIDVQMSRTKRNSLADDLILNDGSIEELRQKIKQLHEKFINTCTIDNSNP